MIANLEFVVQIVSVLPYVFTFMKSMIFLSLILALKLGGLISATIRLKPAKVYLFLKYWQNMTKSLFQNQPTSAISCPKLAVFQIGNLQNKSF